MRISTATIASALLILPLAASAQAEDGRVYYKGGTRIETENTELKFNVQLQPRYGYFDYDSDSGLDNESEFSLRRARLIASGNALNKMFSFKLNQDFASSGGGSDLKDAWIQWNADDAAKVRFGQHKVNFTRQYRNSSTKLYFIERADVTNVHDRDRDRGVLVHGAIGAINYGVGAYNGEGRNSGSDDVEHRFAGSLDFSTPGYDRGHEGDLDAGEFGFTAGGSIVLDNDDVDGAESEVLGLNADAGIRVAGVDVQGEVFYADDRESDESRDTVGFYTQASYTCPESHIGAGVRFGLSDEKDLGDGIDDVTEISGVLNYFLNGHALKAQAQFTALRINPVEGSSETDLIALLQLTGVF